MRNRDAVELKNVNLANAIWGPLPEPALDALTELVRRHGLSVSGGDLQYLAGRWYVTHTGLLRIAQRRRCTGIRVQEVRRLCQPKTGRWVFKATVYRAGGARGFVGYGDADPTNTSSLVRGAEMRVAETRAVNRALRKAYGIGLCSIEELGAPYRFSTPANNDPEPTRSQPQNGSNNDQPRLRDKLCLLIRKYNLDPNLVKVYAADFCGTETLRGASRELVQSFVAQLEKEARENRDQLVCKLNSYSHTVEVRS
jgi:hypothetical protein